jgi:GTP diphosphokinase / guanosine-3',5'-bis(diphosphate) 3'-diphosphatase
MPEVFIVALRFAADKHVSQRRKGCDQIPYINHPIKVVYILQKIGKEIDEGLLSAAILHDVLEDTSTTEQELREIFGDKITDLVIEVTDDMSLTYDDRKRYQIKKAPALSVDAKKIKIADKISNIQDILSLPMTWSNRRKRQYFEWSERVIEGCRGINPKLDKEFDRVLKEAMKIVVN